MSILAKDVLVIVDDGHGLETAGKRTPNFEDGTYIKENVFNHATKELLKESLIAQGFNVYDVSPERTDTTLTLRVKRANAQMEAGKYKKYIFISIHFNSISEYWTDDVGGIETFYYTYSKYGKELATDIHSKLLNGTNLKNRKVKPANFYVLKYTDMYAVLLELGFMSNHVEANLMKNVAYQKECATEITKGVCEFYEIKYQEPTDKLTYYAKIISPNYYDIWIQHFKNTPGLNWEGFMESALKKSI